jgi:hypothetical protein
MTKETASAVAHVLVFALATLIFMGVLTVAGGNLVTLLVAAFILAALGGFVGIGFIAQVFTWLGVTEWLTRALTSSE